MMKFMIAVIALAATAFGAPEQVKRGVCTPATYQCGANGVSWNVCDVSGNWVFAGNCPPKTVCKFFPASGSPYCVPPGFTIP